VRALARVARVWAETSRVDLLELRSRTAQDNGLRPAHRKIAVTLDLPADAETLWRDGLPAKVRSQVRRPRKAGYQFRAGPDLIRDFHAVYREHMRDLGSPALAEDVFHGLSAALGSCVRFAIVERHGQPVAAGCGFVWREGFEITWAAALRAHQRDAPNMLLYWGLMEQCINEGLTLFDFGRCTPHSGTHRFKQQWGGRDVPLPWRQWSSNGATATPTPNGHWRYRLATATWRRLPLPVTNAVGPWLAGQIP
jgi:FemAB-related protein (PEP-CTERM system-associated)